MPVSKRPRPYRTGSVFGDGRRSRLDRNARARWRARLRLFARACRLPAKHEWVGVALLRRLSEDGRCDPAHETLALDVGCSVRTAQRATARMRELGLIRWENRLTRSEANGWQTHQTSNAYELTPDTPNPAIAHGRQSGVGSSRKSLASLKAPIFAAAAADTKEADREGREGAAPSRSKPFSAPPTPQNMARKAAMLANIRARRASH